jgi:hypothetical protein
VFVGWRVRQEQVKDMKDTKYEKMRMNAGEKESHLNNLKEFEDPLAILNCRSLISHMCAIT